MVSHWSSICLSPVHLYFHFRTISCINISGFSPNFVCALMWKSGFGLKMGKFCQFSSELSAHHTIVVGYYHFKFLFFKYRHSIYVYTDSSRYYRYIQILISLVRVF